MYVRITIEVIDENILPPRIHQSCKEKSCDYYSLAFWRRVAFYMEEDRQRKPHNE